MIRSTEFSRVPLPGGEHLPAGWCAVSYRFVEDISQRRRSRNHWYRLRSDYGTIYRVLRFAANLRCGIAGEPSTIAVDYQGWWELQGLKVPEFETLRIGITRAGPVGLLIATWQHPDPNQRMAARLGILSVLLGALSLVLAGR